MIIKLETIPFRTSLKETETRLKYPDLVGGAYIVSVVLNGLTYIIRISYNQFSKSPMFSLLNEEEIYIIQNIIMTPKVTDTNSNLLNMIGFENYILLWNIENGLELFEVVDNESL